ncbi:MAG: aromatic amino acid lyase, partial [Phycisphaerales bacterium]
SDGGKRGEATPGVGGGSGFDVVSAGNFHGMPIALPLDGAAIAIAHVAGISERRVYFMLAATDPEMHLQAFLTPDPGLRSGLMIAQYAAAALVNETIGLAAPATVANIPTCAGIEDYNSFGPRAAAKARGALDLTSKVVAIELVCAAAAIDAHRPLRSGAGVERAHEIVRSVVAPIGEDRPPGPDIEAVAALIRGGAFRPV